MGTGDVAKAEETQRRAVLGLAAAAVHCTEELSTPFCGNDIHSIPARALTPSDYHIRQTRDTHYYLPRFSSERVNYSLATILASPV